MLGGDLDGLYNPFQPPVPADADLITPLSVAKAAFWINFVLAMVNILPGFPLDGGRALRAALWPRFGYRTAVLLVVRAAKLTSVVLLVVAWLIFGTYPFAPLPLASMKPVLT